MAKLRVGLLFGGRSVEHEVSIASATSILSALDPSRYAVQLVAVDPEGHWHLGHPSLPPEATVRGDEVLLPPTPSGGTLVPAGPGALSADVATQLDVVFPIIHGTGGEDGCVQGLLELAGVPYVGCRVLGSAVQMDKDLAKRLMLAEGLPVVPWRTLRTDALAGARALETAADEAALALGGFPVFVKPANSGSSVGTTRATDAAALHGAVREAARYDTKVLIERAVDAREIEVGVIGNADVRASVPGEIRPRGAHEFYDYEAKYADEDTELLIPAPLSEAESERARELAIRAYRSLEGEGFARVDFLMDRDNGTLYVSELNSLPGFTEHSMFPMLWEATGLPYPALLDRLIELALERAEGRSQLETTYRRG